ncbi:MAG: CHAP domain-containing protein [Patescibacteria group bacterium]
MKSRTEEAKQKLFLIAAIGLVVFGFVVSPLARADQFDEQIKQLQADSNVKQQSANQLQVQADSYEGEINRLQGEIDGVRALIRENEAKRDDLQKQITAAEEELGKKKILLSENIKAVYVEGQISTFEMLASSRDLSEFLDQQQYREAIQDKIKSILDTINALKAQLKEQKTLVEKLLADQQAMNEKLNAAQAEQSRLLAYTQDQKNSYIAAIRTNKANIAELRRQQLIANARFIGGAPGSGPACGGGYPARWCEVPQDSVLDTWGMWNRECVSYTAFKVAASGRHMPYWGGHGNAYQWAYDRDGPGGVPGRNAQNAGIPVDSNPREGDVAVSNGGTYGHVMYVEHVYGDGTIFISQYNAGLDGRYSERRISASGLLFIHF